ncbi:MAG TPA: hypothetical protein VGH31_04200 [Acidimicrobiales bacterium]
MSKRSNVKLWAGIAAGAFSLGAVALPSVASASIDKAKAFPCVTQSAVSFAMGNTYSAPKAGPGYVAGAGTCTYAAASGKSFVIARAPLGKSKFAADVKLGTKSDKLKSVTGVGKAATYGTGKTDILFVSQGGNVYEFLDNANKATLKQLEAVAKVVLPK